MPNPTPVAKLSGAHSFRWWCPGCEGFHVVPVNGKGDWEFTGDLVHPTLGPSVLIYSHRTLINTALEGDALTAPENIRDTPRCHSFIREGRIEFLGDCTHWLAGLTVVMEAVDDPDHY